MRLCEMIIQIFFRMPVLVKHETTGVFIAAVKMVVDTACFLARRPYQRQEGVHKFLLFAGLGLRIGDQRYFFGHFRFFLFRRVLVSLKRRASADQVAVAVYLIDATHRRPIFAVAQRVDWKRRLLSAIGVRPIGCNNFF